MPWNVLILLSVLVAAAAVGFLARRNSGHFRGAPQGGTRRPPRSNVDLAAHGLTAHDVVSSSVDVDAGMTIAPNDLPHPLGERATLLQFSSAFCAPCRATRRILADVAAMVPGVTHIDVDAEHHLDLVRRVGVLRTPTTLVLDATGREVTRATGAPTKADVVAALSRATQ